MFLGYILLAIPTTSAAGKPLMFGALLCIACGTGLFKGNLQVMVGNLYDSPKYAAKRDTAFSIFYMAINIGALFAPTAANKVANYFLGKSGLSYDSDISGLANLLINNVDEIKLNQIGSLANLAQAQGVSVESVGGISQFYNHYAAVPELADAPFMKIAEYTGTTDLTGQVEALRTFSLHYLDKLSEAYHYGFAVACVSLIVSMLIYVLGKKTFKGADVNAKQAAVAKAAVVEKEAVTVPAEVELTPSQTKERIVALVLVFAVVIFFWMAFHQNGLTMTFFARDYTSKVVSGIGRIGFNVLNLTCILVAVYALFNLFQTKTLRGRIISFVVAVLAGCGIAAIYSNMDPSMKIGPELFQQFNPFFVVLLTPVSLAIFGMLSKRGIEPSAPRKIGIGMFVAAAGFLILAIGSLGLPTPEIASNLETAGWSTGQWNDFFAKYVPMAATTTAGIAETISRVSPNWLISTYLVLTFAELLLSPMGISFVSKVAPPKYKGMMMGGWFAATAIGNYLVAIIGYLWGNMPLWTMWGVLIVCCLLSALFIFSIMKKLEKVS
jgi:POT family proton-dependent oligopeptide transporter